MIRTKIVCTLGPATDDESVLRALIRGGLNLARMNFSHGTHEEQLKRLTTFRALCAEEGADIPLMLDTRGPEIRLGVFPGGEVTIAEGQPYTFTIDPCDCDDNIACISYRGLIGDVSVGDRLLVDDGLVAFQIREIAPPEIRCVALNGGAISSRKSMNVPGVALAMPFLSDRDREDLSFGVQHGYEYVAVSFARKKEDVLDLARYLRDHGGEQIKLISKIESREGLDNLDDIIRVSDGIMVARGDLGVEIPLEEIPIVQKDMIRRCYRAGKPVITATQMLDSMMRNPRPTRAEVTDVANAIYDGTSAIMLSGETASGKYPVAAFETMRRVAEATEESISYWNRFLKQESGERVSSVTGAIGHATCTTAMNLNAKAIVAVTTSGSTARKISGFRPECPIIATTTDRVVFRQLSLSWGVHPVYTDAVTSTDDLFSAAVDAAKNSGLVEDGDLIVITAGVPVGVHGTTNMLKAQLVGDILLRGRGIGAGSASAPLAILYPNHPAEELDFHRGDILALHEITDESLPLIRRCAALILEGEDREGRAETLAKTLEIPVIVEAEGAQQLLREGTVVRVDARLGTVGCVE